MNQCDIEKYDQFISELSASLGYESSDSIESPSSYVHLHPPRVEDGATAPSRVRVARGGASGTGGALDTPSSWRGGSVGVGYLHLEGDG